MSYNGESIPSLADILSKSPSMQCDSNDALDYSTSPKLPSLADLINKKPSSRPTVETKGQSATLNTALQINSQRAPTFESLLSLSKVDKSESSYKISDTKIPSLSSLLSAKLDLSNQTVPTRQQSASSELSLKDLIAADSENKLQCLSHVKLINEQLTQSLNKPSTQPVFSLGDLIKNDKKLLQSSAGNFIGGVTYNDNKQLTTSLHQLSLSQLANEHFSTSAVKSIGIEKQNDCSSNVQKHSTTFKSNKHLKRKASLFSNILSTQLNVSKPYNRINQVVHVPERFPLNVIILQELLQQHKRMKSVFLFETQSPDDIVTFHQSQSYKRDGLTKKHFK